MNLIIANSVQLFYLGVCGLAGQTFSTLSLQREQPGRVRIVRSSEIVVAYLCQIIIFGIYPTKHAIIGSTIIIISAFAVMIRKLIAS
jgi:drug/metabolite transporter (DMT)-like permease